MSERLAVAGLWSIPGVGAKTLQRLEGQLRLAELADVPIAGWLSDARLPPGQRRLMPLEPTLAELGSAMLERARKAGMQIAWRGDHAYPPLLATVADAPPLLFHFGPGAAVDPRKRVAMVGMRHPDHSFWRFAKKLVKDAAAAGLGVVSGTAIGIDSWAHLCAAAQGGETWGFVGSALDQLDTNPRRLWQLIGRRGATFFSELPPGVRADPTTFPRRNRLISGASDAVLVLRAGLPTGCEHTVRYAVKQGRRVMAVPGDPSSAHAEYCNLLLAHGAQCIHNVFDLVRAVRATVKPSQLPRGPSVAGVDVATLSADAQRVYAHLEGVKCFDDLELELNMTSAALLGALGLLELHGLVLQHSARRFERA